jgi:enterobactin synthetase component D
VTDPAALKKRAHSRTSPTLATRAAVEDLVVAIQSRLRSGFPNDISVATVAVTDRSADLPSRERAAVDNASKRRISTFSSGRWALRLALAASGCVNAIVPRNDNGSPRVPAGWVASISHTDDVALAVASSDKNYEAVGIDVERTADISNELATQIGSARELAALSYQRWTLAQLFTLKESAFKALAPNEPHLSHWREIDVMILSNTTARISSAMTDRKPLIREIHYWTASIDAVTVSLACCKRQPT